MIPYGRQSIDEKDIAAVVEVLRSDFLTCGPQIDKFEKAFSDYIGCTHSIAVANGTAALHLSTLALGVNSKTRVISTPISFVASTNSIMYCGGSVDFVDVEPDSINLDPNRVEDLLKSSSPDTYSGLVVVNFAGLPAKIDDLRYLANKYNLWIIEDSCHALGARYLNKEGESVLCGQNSAADLSIFSFHPVKHITTGEGGMVCTNNFELAQKVRHLSCHGIERSSDKLVNSKHGPWYYEMQNLGYNYRITDIQCALGITQLEGIEKNVSNRNKIADTYTKEFEKNNIKIAQQVPDNTRHAWHLFIILCEQRKKLFETLIEKDIRPQVHYIPIYDQPFYKNKCVVHDCKNAETYYSQCLSLPMFPTLTEDDQQIVIDEVKKFYHP